MFRKTSNERHNYIKNSTKDDVLRYFRELKRLSKADSGLKEIFEMDKKFYIENNIQYGGIFGTGAKKNEDLNFCSKVTGKKGCDQQRMILDKTISDLESSDKVEKKKKTVEKFIHFLSCCIYM